MITNPNQLKFSPAFPISLAELVRLSSGERLKKSLLVSAAELPFLAIHFAYLISASRLEPSTSVGPRAFDNDANFCMLLSATYSVAKPMK